MLKRLLLSSSVLSFLTVSFIALWTVAELIASVVWPTNAVSAVAVAAEHAQPLGITCPLADTTIYTVYLPVIFRPFIFRSDFENGLAGFDEFVAQQGATLEIVDDPTGSGRGKVLKGTISGSPADQGGYLAYRAHPGKSFSVQPFPCRAQEDIWMSKQFYEDVLQKKSAWYSELTPFDSRWHPSVTTALWGDGFMHLDIKGPDGEGVYFPDPVSGAPLFSAETWHTMAVELDREAVAYLYQDGGLVMKGELQPTSQRELIGVHGGPIYGAPTFTLGAFVLVDNFEVICGQ